MPGPSVGYQGEIAGIKCGTGGLAVSLNPSQISLANVIQAEGAIFRQDHWRKEPGSSLFGTNVTPVLDPDDLVIVALNDWHPTETVQRIVHLRGDGVVYFSAANPGNVGDPGAFAATDVNGISGTGTREGFFVTGGQDSSAPTTRKLFLFRINHRLCVVEGDTTDCVPISNPALDWISGGDDAHPPVTGVINGGATSASIGGPAGGRLVAGGNDNNPHLLYFSRSGDQEVFDDVDPTIPTNSQVLSVFPGVGQRIYALANYQGFIVVFKFPVGIFIVDARDDANPLNWLAMQVTNKIGVAASPYAALQLENDVIFLGSDAQFYLLSAVLSSSRGEIPMETANLGMDLDIYQFLIDAFNRGLLSQVQSVYQPFWQTATFTIPGPSSTKNNTRLVFDFNSVGRKGGNPRFSYSYRDKAASLAIHRDPDDQIDKPMFGDYSSNIVLMEQDTRTAWDGAQYPFRVQTPHSNLGEFENLEASTPGKFAYFANRNKNWHNLEVEYIPFTDATVTCSVFVDGIKRQTIDIQLREGGDPLGFSDSDTAGFIIGSSLLAGGVVRSTVHRLGAGAGRRISLLFENEIAGEDVALTHLFLGFNVGDTTETPRR